ncbi:MAG: glycosyltransferase [Candidatus Binatia bacterium]
MRGLTASVLNIDQAALTIHVLERLESLSSAGWSVQLVLVDNGSRPEELQQLVDWFAAHGHRFGEMLLVASSRNRGADGGRNVALTLALHDRILILDNDVILPEEPQWLEALWRHMERDPEIGIVAPLLVFADYPDIAQSAGIALTEQGRVGYLNRADAVASVPPGLAEVVAAPSACWLVRQSAQRAVGLWSSEFHPMQYGDVDFCVRLGVAGWKIVCDRDVRVRHIENVTTRSLKGVSYARVAVEHSLLFREKWSHLLPRIAAITDDDIYWRPIPRVP